MHRTLLAALFGLSVCAFAQTPCEQIKSLAFPDTSVTAAEVVAAGPYQIPGPGAAQSIDLPAHCRVTATLTPTSDSSIEMELWLPIEWNGKFQAEGGGGWAGNVSLAAMTQALKDGYATSSTDTGHKGGGDGSFAGGHPEKVIDYSYRAVHEMTVKAKAMMLAFYGRAPKLSYWNGCSYGGRQGLAEAQQYPEDFDGILAGAPANYHLHLHAFDMKVAVVNLKDEEHLVPPAKLAALNKAVLAACDALDGVKDGLISDPRKCHFDPASLLCNSSGPGADNSRCLTSAQLESVKAMYTPAETKSGKLIYPGMPLGGELGWTRMNTPEPMAVPLGSYRYMLNNDAKWDWHKFDLDRDVAAADEKAPYLNATNPDLSAFQKRGGKLLMYHGWNDQLISAQNSINYYSSVLEKMGPNQSDWYRLFMMPGMMHCRGGPGPDQFNMISVMERWRENNSAPDQITAYHVANNRVEMSRPLCPYPQTAQWKGTGNTNDAQNFVCKAE